ncbi:MAG: hypothetical protein Q9159_005447 [Coniocarpon cinnabarinum]
MSDLSASNEDKGPVTLVIIGIFAGLATLFVSLRFLARRTSKTALIPGIATDLILIVVPLPFIFKLRFIRLWQRLGIGLAFALGSCSTLISIYRLTVVYAHKDSPDVTWSLTRIIIWSAVEYSVGIICACIPSLAPLVRSVLREVYKKSRESVLGRTISSDFLDLRERNAWLQRPRPVATSPQIGITIRAQRSDEHAHTLAFLRNEPTSPKPRPFCICFPGRVANGLDANLS